MPTPPSLLASVLVTVLAAAPCTAQGSPHDDLSAQDWAGIAAAREAARHRIVAVAGGHRAANPGQRWTTSFDGCGSLTTPDQGAWSWGLELRGYGFGEHERRVASPRSVAARGGEISYCWDDLVTEWYVNDRRGVEHGYTVHARPRGADGPLVLTLAVRGGLGPAVSADGRRVGNPSGLQGHPEPAP